MTGVDVFRRYEVNEPTGCWLWTGYVNDDGYARYAGENAHRLFHAEFVAPIPDGWDVDHLCKRRNCVNPEHLEAVPELVNIERSSTRRILVDGEMVRICREGHLVRGMNEAADGPGRIRCWLCARGPQSASRSPYARRLAAIASATF